jgi:flagellar basal body-associated protein FliL
MGTITLVLVVLVVLAIIGGGASTFFGNVSSGVKTSVEFVEKSPTLRNLSEETQDFVQDQASNIVKELH